ncbi:hypothetical protein AOLI_G00326050 [Acnodon oligacanthus]
MPLASLMGSNILPASTFSVILEASGCIFRLLYPNLITTDFLTLVPCRGRACSGEAGHDAALGGSSGVAACRPQHSGKS